MPETPQPQLSPADVSRVLIITLLLFFAFSFAATVFDGVILLLIGELLLIVPAVMYVRIKQYSFADTFRLKSVRLNVMAATALLFLPVYVLADVLDRVVQHFFPMPPEWLQSITELMQFTSWQQTVGVLVAGVVFAAVAEEMLFRGLVQRSLELFREPGSAIVSSSVLFALVHFNPWLSIQILLLGIVLGYFAWKSGSVFPSMMIHGLNNLLSIFMLNAPAGSLDWYAGEFVQPHWVALAAIALLPAWKLFTAACGPTGESV